MVKHEAERGPTDPGGVIKKLINQAVDRFHIYESTQRGQILVHKTSIWYNL